MDIDEKYMQDALREARAALEEGEVPIGAVVVCRGAIIGKGHNMTERLHDPTAHAEMIAITAATEAMGGKYLSDCTLYVTVEPCPMCAGAVINAGLKRLVYGAFDEKGGACSSRINLFECGFSHTPLVRSRVLERECSDILTHFFRTLRSSPP